MAFTGLMVVGLILLLLCILALAGIVILIVGIVFRVKEKKKVSTILFIISGVMLGIVLLIILLAFLK